MAKVTITKDSDRGLYSLGGFEEFMHQLGARSIGNDVRNVDGATVSYDVKRDWRSIYHPVTVNIEGEDSVVDRIHKMIKDRALGFARQT